MSQQKIEFGNGQLQQEQELARISHQNS